LRLLQLSFLLAACSGPSATPPPPATVGAEPAPAGSEPVLRRLTDAAWRQSVLDLIGPNLILPGSLEPDQIDDGLLSIGASTAALSPRGVEQYEAAAQSIATQALAEGAARDALLGCTPAAVVDGACARSAVERLGRRLWRRPLTAEEADRLTALAAEAAETLADFHAGFGVALAAMLQSPNFLYRVELGEPDPSAPGARRFTDWEMASRLSYLLWNSAPDDTLLDEAAAGALVTDAGVTAAVDRMLADPRARRGFRNFIAEMLLLDELDHLIKDPMVFPAMRADVGSSAREETLRAVEALVFDRDDDLRTWLTTRETFVNPTLAMLYGVPAPNLEGFGAVTLPADGPRAGLLGQISLLATHAHPVSSSATRRGVFVREVLLCEEIQPPPANVDTSIPEPQPGALTLRDRVKVHLESPACASCHAITDPIGLGLEPFDGLGVYRTTENGAPIDPSGDLDGTAFADPRGLGAALSQHEGFTRCMADTLYAYAVGHRPGPDEQATLGWLHDGLVAEQHSTLGMLRRLAVSRAFRTVGEVVP
jgi:hypothetical protein